MAALLACAIGCKGKAGGPGMGGGGNEPGNTGSGGGGGSAPPPPPPFEASVPAAAVRKVKGLLVGLAPTDAEVATATSQGTAGLRTLIDAWTTGTDTQAAFRDKMIFFFRNAFQQTGFTPLDDFKPQLLQNGGFDFGPLGTGAVGDDAFARLVQNLQDSFAVTAWQVVSEGRPFTEVLTTQRYMMTTGLVSLYLQIEQVNDQPFAFAATGTRCTTDANCGGAPNVCSIRTGATSGTCALGWKVNMDGTAIPLADTLNPASPNFMVFDDQAPVNPARFGLQPTCQGTAVVNPYTGYAQLFQRLLGYTPRYPFVAQPTCWEHASKPYFTTQDMSDWRWVNVRALKSGEARLQPYNLPALRTTTDLGLALPRVGFYTTPAYLALWNTNDSNQHRVTANQTLLVALGQSMSSENTITPFSTAGLDNAHAVNGSECYGCHKILDPLRQFWANQLDFNDRNDFPARGIMGSAANPRPTTTGGVLAFGNVNAMGATILDLGTLLAQVTDASDGKTPISRFAIAMTQKLCFYANSAPCVETDPEFRRIASAFQQSQFAFPTLVKELFSSPLVTGLTDTLTFDQNGVTVSVARRDQLCAALANRLGKPDVCALVAPLPTTAQAATNKIATALPADAFSRGAESPVTPSSPTLFYRAASEMLCENVAALVVDATAATVYSSSDVDGAIDDMVSRLMGYPAGDNHHASAVQILRSHYDGVLAVNRNTATTALRSTFALACESPTALSFGL